MPRFQVRRYRTRKVFETSTYEIEAADREAALHAVIEVDEDGDFEVDESEVISIKTDVEEIKP
jgi:hypothetical protein